MQAAARSSICGQPGWPTPPPIEQLVRIFQGLALDCQESSSRSLRPHGLEPRIFREGLLELGELLDRLAPMLALTQLSNYLTLKGSFSAVSTPMFASKYALESSRRDLQNALLCTVLESNPKNQENHGEKRTVL